MDNQELIAQLAQFSSLEQLENINVNLEDSIDLDLILTQVLNNTAAAGLIGKMVTAQGSQVALDSSGTADIRFDLDSAAQTVEVTVLDEGGVAIRTYTLQGLDAGRNQVEWDGKDDEGRDRSEGTYSFTVEAYNTEGNAVDVTPIVFGRITGVKFEDGEAVLIAEDVEISISEILEILENQQG